MNNDDEYFPVYVCIMLTIVSNSDSFNSVFPENGSRLIWPKLEKLMTLQLESERK